VENKKRVLNKDYTILIAELENNKLKLIEQIENNGRIISENLSLKKDIEKLEKLEKNYENEIKYINKT
jgi:hypothetical protein